MEFGRKQLKSDAAQPGFRPVPRLQPLRGVESLCVACRVDESINPREEGTIFVE